MNNTKKTLTILKWIFIAFVAAFVFVALSLLITHIVAITTTPSNM
jgi:hypothetical protein